MEGERGIIKNPDVLSEDFIPSVITHRDGQLKALRDNLAPLTEKGPARNSFLYGPPGTGKTLLSRFLISELKEQVPILHSYINCWTFSSRFNILYKILEDCGERLKIYRSGMATDELLVLLKKKAALKPILVILDEVDRAEDEKILYDLLSIPNVCLVLIANSETVFSALDDRIRSRIAMAERIEFQRYKTQEIFEILLERAEYGLVPVSFSKIQISKIAGFSGGDARVGINMLRSIAEEAERRDMERITDSLVDETVSKSFASAKEGRLEQLNEHQKIMLEIVKAKERISSSDLLSELQKESVLRDIEPIAERTFRKYMDILLSAGLVKAVGEGRWRVYSN